MSELHFVNWGQSQAIIKLFSVIRTAQGLTHAMLNDTIAINKLLNPVEGDGNVWLFAYGSLIYKVDFPFIERRNARVFGWARRFWQGSHDHRGTETAPGRVVTLIRSPGSICLGVAFLVSHDVFEHLDHREKNGYLRVGTDITLDDDAKVAGKVYLATEHNPAFLGVLPEREIARQIAKARGPSGPNSDYLLRLAEALRELGVVGDLARQDSHIFAIERHLQEFM